MTVRSKVYFDVVVFRSDSAMMPDGGDGVVVSIVVSGDRGDGTVDGVVD